MENLNKQKIKRERGSMAEVLNIESAFAWYGYFKEAQTLIKPRTIALHNAHVCLEYAEKAGIDHCLPAKVKDAAAMWRKMFGAA